MSTQTRFSASSGIRGLAINCIISMLTLPGPPLLAQVSAYEFEQKTVSSVINNNSLLNIVFNNRETEVIDTNVSRYIFMNTGFSSTDSIVEGPGYPVGFEFEYDGEPVDRVGISGNMYIKLAHSKDGDFAMYNDRIAGGVFAAGVDSLRSNIIAGFQSDYALFKEYQYRIRYGNLGYPGERIFAVGIAPHVSAGGFVYSVPMIIELREWNNQIGVTFSTTYRGPNSVVPVHLGLRGKDNDNEQSNLRIRKITLGEHTWLTSVTGISPSDKCDYNKDFKPNFMQYIFTPPPVVKKPKAPVAFFKEDVKSNPKFIQKIPNGAAEGYFLADSATQVPLNAVLHWSGEYSESSITYDVYLGLDSLNMELLAADISSTSLILPPLAASTRYYYKVVARNDSGASAEKVCWFETSERSEYCYNSSALGGPAYESFTLNTLSHVYNGINVLPDSSIYTTSLKRDTSYLFKYVMPSGAGCSSVRVWIDFNRNGSFDDAGEVFVGNNSVVQIPANAVLGKTKMRITRHLCAGQTIRSCGGLYQDFIITILPSTACQGFVIAPALQLPLCHSDSTGSIDLQPVGGTPPYHVGWLRNNVPYPDSAMMLTDLTSGTYSATVTDIAGCLLQSGVLALAQPAPLSVEVDTTGDLPEVPVAGGTPPYSYTWEGENTFEFTEGSLLPPPGTYSLSVSDSAGCTYEYGTITVPPPASIGAQVSGSGLMLYPNPGSGRVVLRVPRELGEVRFYISDMSGRLIYEGSAVYPGTAFTPLLKPGMYLLHAPTERGLETLKLIRE